MMNIPTMSATNANTRSAVLMKPSALWTASWFSLVSAFPVITW